MKTFYHHPVAQVRQFLAYMCMTASIMLLAITSGAQAQEIEWDKTIGGNLDDEFWELQQTSDGGYILGGSSWSDSSGDKSEGSKGDYDFWIVKVDSAGQKQWDRTIGGDNDDMLYALQQTADGGYILGGTSFSGISGDKTEPNVKCDTICTTDFWIVKLDSAGTIEWDKTIGGTDGDYLTALQQTYDGAYLLGGHSYSNASGDKTEDARGETDFWVVKLDTAGTKLWDKTFGGDSTDILTSLQQTSDGGYILGGDSQSATSGDKTAPSKGGTDYWVVKLSGEGSKEWDLTFGGSNNDYLEDLQQTTDGGYFLGGYSNSQVSGDKTEPNRAGCEGEFCSSDYWVVKLDTAGLKQWDKTIGGDGNDMLSSVQQTADGGYILGGASNSAVSGEKTDSSQGSTDYWVVKLEADGTKAWDKTIGGSDLDYLHTIRQTNDSGYILGGRSNSGISGDKTEENKGICFIDDAEKFTCTYDYWIVKLSGDTTCTPPALRIAVRPTSDTYTGGDSATIFLGYGPQSVQLVASGAERYEWSPATGLSSTTVADPVFTPAAAGTYIFTVTGFNGNCATTASVTITVVDVRCGNNNNNVLVCHNGNQICIPAAAVESHLRNHQEDRLGNCSPNPVTEKTITVSLKVFPNPFMDWAKVEFSLPEEGTYRMELYNANGTMLAKVAEGQVQAGQPVNIELNATKLQKGTYYLRLITPDEVQTVRLMLVK